MAYWLTFVLSVLYIPITIGRLYCGVMKPLADMPSCLEGGDHSTNKV